MNHFCGGSLWLILITGVGYLLCSLFSFSFDMDEWNWFSNALKWIIETIDLFIIADISYSLFKGGDDTDHFYN